MIALTEALHRCNAIIMPHDAPGAYFLEGISGENPMKIDMAELKPSIFTAALFALYALLVIPFLKFILTKYPVPGLSELAQAI